MIVSGGASSAAGGFPKVDTSGGGVKIGKVSSWGASNESVMPAYIGDGDYIELPVADTGYIYYKNSAGTQIYGKNRSNLNAAIDLIIGYFFKGNLLYVIGSDRGVSPQQFYLVSINSAGTVVNIGNDTVDGVATLKDAAISFHKTPLTNLSCHVTYDSTSDLIYIHTYDAANTANCAVAKMNMSGAFVQDFTKIHPIISSSTYGIGYFNDKGVHFSEPTRLEINASPDTTGSAVHIEDLNLSYDYSILQDAGTRLNLNTYKLVCYQNDSTGVNVLCKIHPTSVVRGFYQRFIDRDKFDKWIDDFTNYLGMAVE